MKKILLLCLVFSQYSAYSCDISKPVVMQSTKQVNVFVKHFTDKIKTVLFSQDSDKEKIKSLEIVFDEFLDCQYVKKTITKDFIKKHGIADNLKKDFYNAAFKHLLSRYVKITSDYDYAKISKINSVKIGKEYVATFNIIVKRGKVFKGKLFINGGKIKRAIINDIDLGDSKGVCAKIERDFNSNAEQFISHVNANF